MSSEPDAPTQSSALYDDKGPDSVDPENVSGRKPALVDVVDQGNVYVANAKTKDNGWVFIEEWNGAMAELPPHRVRQIRRIHTEYYGESGEFGSKPKRVADEAWRDRARDSQ